MDKFISLCMIVKNEEKVIDRCLSSIKNLVDEIIVVDTGSTDNTKELVSKYTTNIYDFEWVHDFSAARNYAASKATGKWILVLDADEYVDEENFEVFIKELKKDNGIYDAYYAKILNFTGNLGEVLVQNFHDRIYKNNGEISYYRKIHEQFRNQTGQEIKYNNSNLLIFHSGYLKQTVNEKDKSNRNKKLLENEMKNKNAFDYFNLGNEYSSGGEINKALECYIEAYKLKSDFRLAWVSTTLVQIIICLIQLKRYNDALNVIHDAEKIYGDSPEFPYLKGEIFYLRGQMKDAKLLFSDLINNYEKYNHILFRPDFRDQKPYSRLGDIFLYEESYQESIFNFISVLNINKYNEDAIKKSIYILNRFHTVNEIADFLKSKNLINNKNITSYVRACYDIGNIELALCLLKQLKEEDGLLYKVGILKKIAIEGKGQFEDLHDILKVSVAKDLIKSNWINVVDLFLLRDILTEDEYFKKLMKELDIEDALKSLIDIKNGNTNLELLDKNLFITSFEILLNYKMYSLCTLLLKNVENIDSEVTTRVASVLFAKGFRVEALQLYDTGEWNNFIEQDFINIINSFLETNNKEYAIEVAQYGISIYENDFRFYAYILENVDTHQYIPTLEKAKSIFKVSYYLESIKH
ncbi:tetratricopeptide repeat-containing glycosyltransferase family 2 protein [Metabacillus halosaccharovorans]|uniref:tetratricopeptide repeat-containing glycosyltransferase family 2 protein n=1 Tax=Metabacillus halosaccharovorans TaxID=930124 RepID=UPI00099559FE|nr:glycosyltransferase family 2 protein [Metabacillus halosaccharovorans]